MKKILGHGFWALVSVAAAFFVAGIAMDRGEPVNSFWLVLAAACTYMVGFRFYAKFIAAKVMVLNDQRATPAERLRDGLDFEPTNKWIVFGHHFAAIAGPGPLVGPTLAAQFGYLPGALWIIIGCVLGGAVQDFVILFSDGSRGNRKGWRVYGAAYRSVHHGDPTGCGGAGGGQRSQGQPVGDFHHSRDYADRAIDGRLPSILASRQSVGMLGSRIYSGAGEHFRWPGCSGLSNVSALVHYVGHCAGDRHYHLWILRQRTAGLAIPGSSRLSQHVRQAGRGDDAGRRNHFCASHPAVAGIHALHGWRRSNLRR